MTSGGGGDPPFLGCFSGARIKSEDNNNNNNNGVCVCVYLLNCT